MTNPYQIFIHQYKTLSNPVGTIAFFNPADTKRQNDALGHKVVDADLDLFVQILQQTLPTPSIIQRSGASWMIFYPSKNHDIQPLLKIIAQFKETRKGLGRWSSHAKSKSGEIKDRRLPAVEISIERAVRCSYGHIDEKSDLTEAYMVAVDWGCINASVNRPVLVEIHTEIETLPKNRQPWQCIQYLSTAEDYCPSCLSREFEWWNDDDSNFGEHGGVCKKCGAEVSIRTSFEIIAARKPWNIFHIGRKR